MFGNLFGSSKPKPKPTSAGAAPPAPKPAPSTAKKRVNLLKRFTIIAETNQGSMSKVYKAMDNESGRTVCLKVQDKVKTAAATARADQSTRPLEGDIALKITGPHIVKTYEHGDSNKGEYYVVMEFIDGQSLTFVRQSRTLKIAEKIELLAQAADGLAEVHKSGFIHHDFGPKNLLIDRNDRVKLIDFGLAVPNTAAFRRPGNRTGTLQYMAPELIRREPTDERLDIFSFGVAAFEFLAGKLPYDAVEPMAIMRQRMNIDPMVLADVAPRLPRGLCDLIQKSIARKKEDRWPKMSTLADALRELPEASG